MAHPKDPLKHLFSIVEKPMNAVSNVEPMVEQHVIQGRRPFFVMNRFVGRFELRGEG